jgi:hypothetical protein
MRRSPATWREARRSLAVACALLLMLTFAAANFILVEVRLWVLDVRIRLAWAVLGAAAIGFAAGVAWCRSGRRDAPAEVSRDAPAADGRT